ncbi:hypothetical protein MTDSW087_04600 [Methylobacterium dankookense]|uniref:Uncharacterized protein n=1 Tax=Methylobacterium dankookense TaxID=560405 RepID=A0A564G495_9HYPH|nr:hypothetical protein IFDJLNFL_2805 [Methylobacterium dankookense]VUF14874.1 hypothetical protein MTDSW087_04600 [Methylobacterium dankookense]
MRKRISRCVCPRPLRGRVRACVWFRMMRPGAFCATPTSGPSPRGGGEARSRPSGASESGVEGTRTWVHPARDLSRGRRRAGPSEGFMRPRGGRPNRAGDGLRWGISRVRSRAVLAASAPLESSPPGCPREEPLGFRPGCSGSGRYGVMLGWSHACLLSFDHKSPCQIIALRTLPLGRLCFPSRSTLRDCVRIVLPSTRKMHPLWEYSNFKSLAAVQPIASIDLHPPRLQRGIDPVRLQGAPVTVRRRSANQPGSAPVPRFTTTVAVMPATSGTPSGTWSMRMRTGTRWARRTQV